MTTTTIPRRSVEEGRPLVAEAMRAALDRLDAGTRHVCGYHLGFWDAAGAPVTGGGGKGLRATLALHSAQAVGAPLSVAVPAAAACELVHNFSLLHDDVMDGDRERRHRPTAWAVFGVPAAVLAGDALLTLAVELLAESGSPTAGWAVRALTGATRRLIAGQTQDVAFESAERVSVPECLQMAADKTGALLECAASLGAVLADGPARVALGLADYGAHLGLAFQLTDDLLGLWGSPAATGKPVRSDLRSRKRSVPVVVALESGTAAGRQLQELYARSEPLDEAELVRAADLVQQAGGRRWTEQCVDDELAAARAALVELALPADVAAALTTLADALRGRDR